MLDPSTHRLLKLPEFPVDASSIRTKALVFRDARSAALLASIDQIAPTDASVLLIGETGTGKELIARRIHAYSERTGPFVAVNCGAFSESLIDAELFGHESGAFTGASHARAGWFEAANGGTLFLDEVGDLPIGLQVKLLRVLQERQVVRLGSRRPVHLDIRIVCATNVDLAKAVEARQFRSDLYYRLNVASVQLPSLRERPGDILPLARHFIGVYAPRLEQVGVSLSAPAEQALLDHAWPGNIRELENVIHFATIVCRHHVIERGDLKLIPGFGNGASAHDDGARLEPIAHTALPTDIPPGSASRRRFEDAIQGLLDEPPHELSHLVESTLVHAAYHRVKGHKARTARLLGVTSNALRTLLKRHGLLTGPDASDTMSSGFDADSTHGDV